nr:unnamed protein product [Spirometra erinaceieuropaei]
MSDERQPKQVFYGDAAIGDRRKAVQTRRYKDTPKNSLKRLQINPNTWEDLTRNQLAWRRAVKTGSVKYKANRIAAANDKRESRKCQTSLIRNANTQALLICPRCLRTFWARIGLARHIRRSPSPPMLRIIVAVGHRYVHHLCHKLRGDDDDGHRSSHSRRRPRRSPRPVAGSHNDRSGVIVQDLAASRSFTHWQCAVPDAMT